MKPGWWQSRVCTTSNSSQATQLQKLDPPTRAALTKLDDLRSELLLHQPVDATQNKKWGVLCSAIYL